ncbi:uncharacterized protein HaLaN_06092 [Haematococcus lacustris]|uniref:Uncharacterized protein n=1 Tax=Haematococcus lacustris TaxID=44745 RepID=A0A699YUR5_HAELA|nr:uncharacterized protein HaLaN_06092 [Haematococcus lacustris]
MHHAHHAMPYRAYVQAQSPEVNTHDPLTTTKPSGHQAVQPAPPPVQQVASPEVFMMASTDQKAEFPPFNDPDIVNQFACVLYLLRLGCPMTDLKAMQTLLRTIKQPAVAKAHWKDSVGWQMAEAIDAVYQEANNDLLDAAQFISITLDEATTVNNMDVMCVHAYVLVNFERKQIFLALKEMAYDQRQEGYAALGSFIDGDNQEGVRFAFGQGKVMQVGLDVAQEGGGRRSRKGAQSEGGSSLSLAALPAPKDPAAVNCWQCIALRATSPRPLLRAPAASCWLHCRGVSGGALQRGERGGRGRGARDGPGAPHRLGKHAPPKGTSLC